MNDRKRFVPGLNRVVSMAIIVAMTAVTVSVLHGPPAESPANAADLTLLAAATAEEATYEDSPRTAAEPGDFYLKIDGIDGESQHPDHEDWIDAFAFSWGLAQSATATHRGGGAGRVSVQDLSFTKLVDKSTPSLYSASANATVIREAVLVARKRGAAEPYFEIKMENVIISSVNTSGSAGEDRPTENVSLNFAKVTISYRQQQPDGSFGDPVEAELDFS